eukprot:m.224478 g.224478  ORF g.224478 m.224478 type:complete len:1052 (-) comp17290_c0_seq5:1993-5148(-)
MRQPRMRVLGFVICLLAAVVDATTVNECTNDNAIVIGYPLLTQQTLDSCVNASTSMPCPDTMKCADDGQAKWLPVDCQVSSLTITGYGSNGTCCSWNSSQITVGGDLTLRCTATDTWVNDVVDSSRIIVPTDVSPKPSIHIQQQQTSARLWQLPFSTWSFNDYLPSFPAMRGPSAVNISTLAVDAGTESLLHFNTWLDQFPVLQELDVANVNLSMSGHLTPYNSMKRLAFHHVNAEHVIHLIPDVFPQLNELGITFATPPLKRIPALAGLKQLWSLDLEDNALTQLTVKELAPVSQTLASFSVFRNNIAEVEAGLFSRTLSQLTVLGLGKNKLTTLDGTGVDQLKKLQELYLDYNMLSSLQGVLSDRQTALTTIDLQGNRLTSLTLPDQLGNDKLVELSLRQTPIPKCTAFGPCVNLPWRLQRLPTVSKTLSISNVETANLNLLDSIVLANLEMLLLHLHIPTPLKWPAITGVKSLTVIHAENTGISQQSVDAIFKGSQLAQAKIVGPYSLCNASWQHATLTCPEKMTQLQIEQTSCVTITLEGCTAVHSLLIRSNPKLRQVIVNDASKGNVVNFAIIDVSNNPLMTDFPENVRAKSVNISRGKFTSLPPVLCDSTAPDQSMRQLYASTIAHRDGLERLVLLGLRDCQTTLELVDFSGNPKLTPSLREALPNIVYKRFSHRVSRLFFEGRPVIQRSNEVLPIYMLNGVSTDCVAKPGLLAGQVIRASQNAWTPLIFEGYEVVCTCSEGYEPHGKYDCRPTIVLPPYLLPIIFSGLALVAAGVLVNVLHNQRRQIAHYKSLAEQQLLLQHSEKDRQQLEQAWNISPDSLDFIALIGRGGFGDVWSALWKDRLVCVKKMQLMFVTSMDEFATEIAFMMRHRHEYLVEFLGAWNCEGQEPLLVMEHANCGSLKTFLGIQAIVLTNGQVNPFDTKGEAPEWPLRLQLLINVMHGLQYIHSISQSTLHRDVKSDNVLVFSTSNLAQPYVAKVADFGSIKMQREAAVRRNSTSSGTGSNVLSQLSRRLGRQRTPSKSELQVEEHIEPPRLLTRRRRC